MLFFETQRRPDLTKPDFSLVDSKASTEPTWCTNSAHGAHWAGQRAKVLREIALERDLTLRGVRAKPVWTWVDPRLSSRQAEKVLSSPCSIASAFNNAVRNPWISLGISNIFWMSSVHSRPNHKGIILRWCLPAQCVLLQRAPLIKAIRTWTMGVVLFAAQQKQLGLRGNNNEPSC